MNVIVTGGAGYIGSIAVERLVERGDRVTVIDNLWRGHANAVHEDANLIQLDIRDAAGVDAAIASVKPDAVLHFAAATIVPESVANPADYYSINVSGVINVLSAMQRAGVGRLIFSSTAAVYGEPTSSVLLESAPLQPINPYGVSKHVGEQLLPAFEAAYGINSVAFRYFNVAGATRLRGEDHRPETHVIPVALQTLLGQRSSFSIYGTDYPTPDGTAVRDFVHVIDLVDAHLLALDMLERPLGAFNLGSRDGYSVRQIVEAIERVTGRQLPIHEAPRRPGDAPALIADSARARTELGWNPSHSSLDEMIGTAWEWMQRHPNGYGEAG
jgi:UDP-glucose 4-epimerase